MAKTPKVKPATDRYKKSEWLIRGITDVDGKGNPPEVSDGPERIAKEAKEKENK